MHKILLTTLALCAFAFAANARTELNSQLSGKLEEKIAHHGGTQGTVKIGPDENGVTIVMKHECGKPKSADAAGALRDCREEAFFYGEGEDVESSKAPAWVMDYEANSTGVKKIGEDEFFVVSSHDDSNSHISHEYYDLYEGDFMFATNAMPVHFSKKEESEHMFAILTPMARNFDKYIPTGMDTDKIIAIVTHILPSGKRERIAILSTSDKPLKPMDEMVGLTKQNKQGINVNLMPAIKGMVRIKLAKDGTLAVKSAKKPARVVLKLLEE